ncbi:MAG: hypothetical protein HY906_01945 [Deltaproteobacteria bacterium]|nr:hypothetical protein [Deltaproteobacteria bacterium]
MREIVAFIDDVNAARLSLYGTLIGRVQQHGLPRDWPNRFFRRSVRGARSSAGQPQ